MLRYPQPHLGPDRLRDWRLHNTTGMLSSQWQIQDTTIFAERYRTLLGQTELPGSLRPGSVPKIVVPWHFRDKSPRKTRKAHTLRSVCSYYTAQFSPWCLRFGSPGKCVFWQTMVNDQRPKLMVQMHGIDIDGLVDTRADVNILAQKSWSPYWSLQKVRTQFIGIGELSQIRPNVQWIRVKVKITQR